MNVNFLEQLHFVVLKISTGAIATPFGIMAGLTSMDYLDLLRTQTCICPT